MKALHRVPKKGLKTTAMLGKQVPDFSLQGTAGTNFSESARRGTKLVLFFHPKRQFKQEIRFPFELLRTPMRRSAGRSAS
jgi:hypothetical protein